MSARLLRDDQIVPCVRRQVAPAWSAEYRAPRFAQLYSPPRGQLLVRYPLEREDFVEQPPWDPPATGYVVPKSPLIRPTSA